MYQATYIEYDLEFKIPAETSRGILNKKKSWFIVISDSADPTRKGIGECSLIPGLSLDDRPDFEEKLKEICTHLTKFGELPDELNDFPSIRFGFETALLDLNSKTERILFPTDFTKGQDSMNINGLIWMGDFDFMKKQIKEKLQDGFRCIKLKIGAIDFEQELALLKGIRKEFSADIIELRVDANGAFSPDQALEKLNSLSDLDLHSIEQPIKQGQHEAMARLCEQTPLPIALDEELIGVNRRGKKESLLDRINPQYIILKPSLVGGLATSEEWINIVDKRNIGWWITSALESNIGLNAIAQWAYTLGSKMPQGLGTGKLYNNNFDSPLHIANGQLSYGPSSAWNLNNLLK